MSVLADLIANAKSFSATAQGKQRAVYQRIAALLARAGDFNYLSNVAATNAVQTVTKLTGNTNGGTYKLTVFAPNGSSVQTAGIAYDAVHATIQSAIDTAATSHFPGWTNGDIVVAGGPLKNSGGADITLTFSGASVAGARIAAATIDVTSVTVSSGSAATSSVSVGTQGQKARPAWAVLFELGIVTGTIPNQGDDATGVTVGSARPWPFDVTDAVVAALIDEAAIADGSLAVKTTLRKLLVINS